MAVNGPKSGEKSGGQSGWGDFPWSRIPPPLMAASCHSGKRGEDFGDVVRLAAHGDLDQVSSGLATIQQQYDANVSWAKPVRSLHDE